MFFKSVWNTYAIIIDFAYLVLRLNIFTYQICLFSARLISNW